MLEITEAAVAKLQELMQENKKEGYALRIAIAGRGPQGFLYQLGFVNWDNKSDEDTIVDHDDIQVPGFNPGLCRRWISKWFLD